jgi:hypothetical protein
MILNIKQNFAVCFSKVNLASWINFGSWNQCSPITSYSPRLGSYVQYCHWLLNWSLRLEVCMQHCRIIQTFKVLWRGKAKNSSGNVNHLSHFSNFQLLCDAQAKNLNHFYTEALELSDNFTHPTVIFRTPSFPSLKRF